MEHTKGPWSINGNKIDGNGYHIASINSHATKEGKANSILMSSAPEMAEEIEQLKEQRDELLEAAKLVLSNKRGEDDWLILSIHCAGLEAAIAKATSK